MAGAVRRATDGVCNPRAQLKYDRVLHIGWSLEA